LAERCAKCRIVRAVGRRLGQHNHIEPTQLILLSAEHFADLPFDPVARDGLWRHARRHADPEAGALKIVSGDAHLENVVTESAALPECCGEFLSPGDAARPGEALPGAIQGESRARPFARRALSTARPPLVLMRARNPCVRLRLSLLGW
jgi:hypothetical protein